MCARVVKTCRSPLHRPLETQTEGQKTSLRCSESSLHFPDSRFLLSCVGLFSGGHVAYTPAGCTKPGEFCVEMFMLSVSDSPSPPRILTESLCAVLGLGSQPPEAFNNITLIQARTRSHWQQWEKTRSRPPGVRIPFQEDDPKKKRHPKRRY